MRNGHRDVPIASSMLAVAGTAFASLGLAYFTALILFEDFVETTEGYLFAIAALAGFGVMLYMCVREIRVLAGRWQSPLALPLLWTAATGALVAYLGERLLNGRWGLETVRCVGEECSTVTEYQTGEALFFIAISSIVIGGFLASVFYLVITWRSMRRVV